jgi:hypothetical protein
VYAAWLGAEGADASGLPIPEREADTALAVMDHHGIVAAVRVAFDDDARAQIDRSTAAGLFPRSQGGTS